MRWPWRKQHVHHPTDIAEAREMRAEAREDYQRAVGEWFTVAEVAGYLAERRALNHFGESIQITFTRRGK